MDSQALGKFNCGSPNKTFQCARDGCTRDTGEDRFFIENARNQSEGSFFFDDRDRLLNQIDLTHEFVSQRELPLFSGEFRKRSKCDLACCNGHGIKRADGLIMLPDTFAALDLDLKIARFVPDLDYLMASTRQCLLNQFADLSVCANQNNFHKNSILRLACRATSEYSRRYPRRMSCKDHAIRSRYAALPVRCRASGRGETEAAAQCRIRRSPRRQFACSLTR